MNSKLFLAVAALAGLPLAMIASLPASAAPAPTAPASFAQCAACHATDASSPARIGPHLAKVMNRKAGSVPGYAYSAALKNSGIIWNVQKMDAWLEKPAKIVPGNKMPYAGMSDAAKRAELIAFMKKL
jgi:cytochrome c